MQLELLEQVSHFVDSVLQFRQLVPSKKYPVEQAHESERFLVSGVLHSVQLVLEPTHLAQRTVSHGTQISVKFRSK